MTVAANALNRWFGAVGGMFILVDYFLTAAISCLSGILYFSVVFPSIGPMALWLTVGVLILLGILNWVGISESAKVSLVGAIIAFISDIAILVTVFSHLSVGEVFGLFGSMFSHHNVPPIAYLTGFAGAFLAFSGLESISQLSPVMKTPRKKVGGIALLLVVLTIGLTSPLLTMFATLLLPKEAADATLSTQLISRLAGHWGSGFLQTEVAISASALLVFASNTAIIGAYHVFMALSRMEFFPAFVLQRNKLRGTPHYSIALATGVPIIVLLAVSGNVNTLGDMYAFGLLGAFTLTCLGLDVLRTRDRRAARALMTASREQARTHSQDDLSAAHGISHASEVVAEPVHLWKRILAPIRRMWYTLDFWLGILTTALVAIAWTTNLVAKPLATVFGGGVAAIGMAAAYYNYRLHARAGRVPVTMTMLEERMPNSILAVLRAGNAHNEDVLRSAIRSADGRPLVFLYVGEPRETPVPRMFEVVDPYLDDEQAKETFGKAESLALKAKVGTRRYVYRQETPGTVSRVWQIIHPHDTIVSSDEVSEVEDINPDRITYEVSNGGNQVAHMVKRW